MVRAGRSTRVAAAALPVRLAAAGLARVRLAERACCFGRPSPIRSAISERACGWLGDTIG